jgi:hypothetical protein
MAIKIKNRITDMVYNNTLSCPLNSNISTWNTNKREIWYRIDYILSKNNADNWHFNNALDICETGTLRGWIIKIESHYSLFYKIQAEISWDDVFKYYVSEDSNLFTIYALPSASERIIKKINSHVTNNIDINTTTDYINWLSKLTDLACKRVTPGFPLQDNNETGWMMLFNSWQKGKSVKDVGNELGFITKTAAKNIDSESAKKLKKIISTLRNMYPAWKEEYLLGYASYLAGEKCEDQYSDDLFASGRADAQRVHKQD